MAFHYAPATRLRFRLVWSFTLRQKPFYQQDFSASVSSMNILISAICSETYHGWAEHSLFGLMLDNIVITPLRFGGINQKWEGLTCFRENYHDLLTLAVPVPFSSWVLYRRCLREYLWFRNWIQAQRVKVS